MLRALLLSLVFLFAASSIPRPPGAREGRFMLSPSSFIFHISSLPRSLPAKFANHRSEMDERKMAINSKAEVKGFSTPLGEAQ